MDLGGLLVLELSKDNSCTVFSCAYLIGMSDLAMNIPGVESMLRVLMEDHLERANYFASDLDHQKLKDRCPRPVEAYSDTNSQFVYDYIRCLLPNGRISHHALLYAVCRLAFNRLELWRWTECIQALGLEAKLMSTLRGLDQESEFHFCNTDDDLHERSS